VRQARRGLTEPQACDGAEQDRADLRHRRGAEQNDQRGDRRHRGPLAIRAKRPRHAPHRLRDNRHRDKLETVQQSCAKRTAQRAGAIGEQHQ
jgi:hypothetical protein